jgi:hypothetical protein
VFISFVSTVIVFPPNFLLVVFFKRCRQKKNAVMQVNQDLTKKNQKHRWRNVSHGSAIWGDKVRLGNLRLNSFAAGHSHNILSRTKNHSTKKKKMR